LAPNAIEFVEPLALAIFELALDEDRDLSARKCPTVLIFACCSVDNLVRDLNAEEDFALAFRVRVHDVNVEVSSLTESELLQLILNRLFLVGIIRGLARDNHVVCLL
jgi:hypothetical protein